MEENQMKLDICSQFVPMEILDYAAKNPQNVVNGPENIAKWIKESFNWLTRIQK